MVILFEKRLIIPKLPRGETAADQLSVAAQKFRDLRFVERAHVEYQAVVSAVQQRGNLTASDPGIVIDSVKSKTGAFPLCCLPFVETGDGTERRELVPSVQF